MSNITITCRPGDIIITVIAEGDFDDLTDVYVAPVAAAFDDWEDPIDPITADQRRALFATFTDVFGQSGSEQRHAFTRMALCRPVDDVVSWSSARHGSLTFAEASKVLDALNLLNV